MSSLALQKIGLILAEGDAFSPWCQEAADQAGLIYERVEFAQFDLIDRYRVLVFCGRGTLEARQKQQLTTWLALGGSIICTGSTWGLEEILGLELSEFPTLGRDQLISLGPDRLWKDSGAAILFFGGQAAQVTSATVVAKTKLGRPALTRNGRHYFFAPHIGQTMAMAAMGHSVECDAPGPGDGSAETADGKLRAEDGSWLRFDQDRTAGPNPIFLTAFVDALRDVWVRMILEAVEKSGATPFLLWHLPNNAEAMGVCTVDADDLEPNLTVKIINSLGKFGIKASWLVQTPGYSQDAYKVLKKHDHDIGLLFQGGKDAWDEDQLKVESLTISRACGAPHLAVFRPSDGRWQNYSQFYEMAEQVGARLVSSKGGRQAGTSGHLFGTNRLFAPHRRSGSKFRLLELPYTIYSPGFATADASVPALVEEICRNNGILHFGYSTTDSRESTFERSAQNLHMMLRQSRFQMSSPEQMAFFELARRSLKITIGAERSLSLISDTQLKGLTLLIGGQNLEGRTIANRVEGKNVMRYGMKFSAVTVSLEARAQMMLKIEPQRMAA